MPRTIPHPLDEAEAFRLKALKELEILDTEAEERFDRLTHLACAALDMPTALISLLDADRQWFKSRQGLDVAETPIDVSFCRHAVDEDGVMVVPDAAADPRFADNPLVTGAPGVRFYAGAPLTLANGARIGTLCVIDYRPRDITPAERRQLADLASLATIELESRLIRRRLARERQARLAVERLIEDRSLELFEARRRAELASRAKTEFLANMGHEFRTPLNAVIGFSEALAGGIAGAVSPRQIAYLQHIQDAGRRLQAVLNQVLDMAQIELGHVRLWAEPVAPDALVDFALAGLQVQIAERDIVIDRRLPPDLPHLVADRAAASRILLQLLDNAVKFSPRGGRVAVAVEAIPGGLRFSIADQGPGIPAERLAVIRQPFVQADGGLNRRHEGAGLGLAIAQGLADAQGGQLEIDSRAGAGTRVSLSLPLMPPEGGGI